MQKKRVFILMMMCFTSLVHADVKQTPSLEKNIHLVEDFSSQWGAAALQILGKPTVFSQQALSVNTLNNGVVTSIQNSLMSNNVLSQSQLNSINANYTFGRFYAETGLLSQNSDVLDNSKFYLQGSYSIFIKNNFDLLLTAKYEAIDPVFINNYVTSVEPIIDAQTLFNYDTQQATIGVVSIYSINKRWKLLGSLTTTAFDKSLEDSPLNDINNTHMALIGTSYSF